MIVIRLNPSRQTVIDEALDEIQKNQGCCDEIWLAVNTYDCLENHVEKAKLLGKYIERIRMMGIRPVLEIGTNLGHGNAPSGAKQAEVIKNFRNMRSKDQKDAKGHYCPAGEAFLLHQCEAIKLYAEKQPDIVYLDDDLRIEWHGEAEMGCFCESCIREFNETNKTDYTAEQLGELVDSDICVRGKYIEMNRKHLYEYARRISEAVISVCPDAKMGWEGVFPSSAMGDDLNPVLDAMHDATGKDVLYRPGFGVYNDINPRDIIDKVFHTSYQTVNAPHYVKMIRPEIENTSHTVMGKTVAGTCLEASLNLAYGCKGLSFSVCQSGSEPMETRKRMWKSFSQHRHYWQGLISDSENSGNFGVRPVYFPDAWKAKTDSSLKWMYPPIREANKLLQMGLPMTYDDDYSRVCILHNKMVKYLSDEDIKTLLGKNVITDGIALNALKKRGYDFPLSAIELRGIYAENYTDHKANGKMAGKRGLSDGFCGDIFYQYFENVDGCEILAYDDSNNVCEALFDTKSGGKWAFVGYHLFNNVINGVKRNQLISLVDYLWGGLPAYLETPSQVTVIPRCTREGKFKAVTLQNISIDETDNLELIVKDPVSESFVLSSPKAQERELTFVREGERLRIEVPSIAPWGTVTVRAK